MAESVIPASPVRSFRDLLSGKRRWILRLTSIAQRNPFRRPNGTS